MSKSRGIKTGIYRSKFENSISEQLKKENKSFTYEEDKIKFIVPEKKSTYTPDFTITKKNGKPLFIETKGVFDLKDRTKHLLIKKQHPDLDIRFVFQTPNKTISKQSTTTYADWCNKNGYKWADTTIPKRWLNE